MNNNIGIVRKIDPLGRIVIPAEIRRTLGIKDNELLDISVSDNSIILQRHTPTADIELFIRNFICVEYGSVYQDYLITKELCSAIEGYIKGCIEPNLLKESSDDFEY